MRDLIQKLEGMGDREARDAYDELERRRLIQKEFDGAR